MQYYSSRGSVVSWRQAAAPTSTLAPRPRWSVRSARGVRGRTYLSYGSLGTTLISCGIGTATASGLPATIGLATAVQCGIGAGVASGLAVTIGLRTAISCTVGTGTASGLPATISAATLIARAVAEAYGSGLPVTITLGTVPVKASTASRTAPQLSGATRPAQRTRAGRPRQLS